MKLAMLTPGISLGYWKARKRPARERSSGSISEDVFAVEEDSRRRGLGDLVVGMAGEATLARVLLPVPLGPMMAWTS
jgi:hypothetical protein